MAALMSALSSGSEKNSAHVFCPELSDLFAAGFVGPELPPKFEGISLFTSLGGLSFSEGAQPAKTRVNDPKLTKRSTLDLFMIHHVFRQRAFFLVANQLSTFSKRTKDIVEPGHDDYAEDGAKQ